VSKQQILFLFIPNTKGSVPAGALLFVFPDLAASQLYVFLSGKCVDKGSGIL
jgi:hypothetical protein